MTLKTEPIKHLRSLFSRKPCWTIGTLASEMQYSVPSTRRFLSETGYYSSITHNGKWYTLSSVTKFSKEGLWFYEDIGFSRFGSLTKTLVHLVTQSVSGMSAEQLGLKVRNRCHSVLIQLCRQGKLMREKQGSSFVYLSADPQTAIVQRQSLQSEHAVQLPSEIALLVFTECIRHPFFNFKQIANVVSQKSDLTIGVAQIERLFDQYGLKKTTRIMARKS